MTDPFDLEMIKCLTKIKHPVVSWNNFHGCVGSVKSIKPGKELYLHSGHYLVSNFVARKGDVSIYVARFLRSFTQSGCDSLEVTIRVYESLNNWEFYVCVELQRRLLESAADVNIYHKMLVCYFL